MFQHTTDLVSDIFQFYTQKFINNCSNLLSDLYIITIYHPVLSVAAVKKLKRQINIY